MAINVLKSKIGRETFALSTLIAVVPLAIVGTISLGQVSNVFDEKSRGYLDETVRAFGRVVYERLLLTSELLVHLEPGEIHKSEANPIAGLMYVAADGTVTNSNIEPSPQLLRAAVSASRPTLLIEPGAQTSDVYVLQPMTGGTTVGLVSPDFLWGDPAEYPYFVDYCAVVQGVDQPIFCSSSLSVDTLEAVLASTSTSGTVEWFTGEAQMNSAFWELFSRSYFDGPLIRFVSTQPRTVGFAGWSTFLAIYAPALIITAGLIVLASSFHVRRILHPVNVLLSTTKRFAQGELTARATVERADEFAELAEAMNSMAAQLRLEFRSMNRLSDIDQIILSGMEVDEIADLVLEQSLEADDISFAAIAILDQNSGEDAVWHYKGTGAEGIVIDRIGVDETTLSCISNAKEATLVDEIKDDKIRELFSRFGVAQILGIPVLVRDRCEAVLLLGREAISCTAHTSTDRQRALAGRFAVALETRRRERELVSRATIDGLTGLPNRELCHDRLEQSLIQARKGGHRLSVAFIDLDRFKHINDSFGHASGDKLLIEASRRIVDCVGETETVARLGGDEFVVLIPEVNESPSPQQITDRILAELSKPFSIGASQVFISASIGVASYPRHGDTVEALLRKADLAMYGAKDAGRDQAYDFTVVMEERVSQRVNLETELRNALDRNEFSLVYQAQFQLATNQCIAAEALLRWDHPTRGSVSPADFIPIAEETGYIKILGAWVMSNACRQLKKWQDDGLFLSRIAVNVSAEQFGQPEFVSQVTDCIENARIDPSCLELEVTESVFVGDLDRAIEILERLKSLGVSIAIDDFGTGYSSLSYLKSLPFDIVKVDRAFIKDIPEDRDSCAIVNAVAAMAHTLEKEVVAEGIETATQKDYLRRLGIELGQGYLLGKPLAPGDFEAHLETSRARAAGAVHSH